MATSNDHDFLLVQSLDTLDRCQVALLLEDIVRHEHVLHATAQKGEPSVKLGMQTLLTAIREHHSFRSESYLNLSMLHDLERLFFSFEGRFVTFRQRRCWSAWCRSFGIDSNRRDASSCTNIGRRYWVSRYSDLLLLPIVQHNRDLLPHGRGDDVTILHELYTDDPMARKENTPAQHRVNIMKQVIARVV